MGAIHYCSAASCDPLALSIVEGFLMGVTLEDIAAQRAAAMLRSLLERMK